MKVICWNIQKIGSGKVNKRLTSVVRNCGLGNTVLDYIVNFVTGSSVWNNGVNGVPADVFIIIEMISNRQGKGRAATGSAVRTQQRLLNAMNNEMIARNIQGQYNYASIAQQNISRGETVGVIYNTVTLTNTAARSVRDNNVHWLNPRTPFLTRFTTVAPPHTPINIIGIHAPTKNGEDIYDTPLQYADNLATVPEIIQQAESMIIMGDYNCSTSSKRIVQEVNNGKRRRVNNFGFTDLRNLNYTTLIPNPMRQQPVPTAIYSSVRKKVNNDYAAPLNYMSDAFDTALYHLVPPAIVAQNVNNMIANAQNTIGPVMQGNRQINNLDMLYPNHLATLLRVYNLVSDHFPVTMTF
jgi:hypothetical protein